MAEDEAAAAAIGFDKAKAVELGLILKAAYAMYKPGDLTPPPVGISSDYQFVAWVQMQDFSVGSSELEFYGIVVHEATHPGRYVLAIRGTQGQIEWFDDFTALYPVPWAGGGNVGFGFKKIYETLRIAKPNAGDGRMGGPLAQSGEGFAEQVARVTNDHHMKMTKDGAATPITVSVVGHSLGAALATLYASDNHRAGYKNAPLLCTFASPFVGDAAFAQSVDALRITSWRIVNSPDLVPKVPPFEYKHVQIEERYDSGHETVTSPLNPALMFGCWHSLQTYLHLLDKNQPIETACLPRSTIFGAPRMSLAEMPSRDVSVTLPRDTGTTINITIKVGG